MASGDRIKLLGGREFQRFTSSGTFTVPAGVKHVFVSILGAGGGGGSGGLNGGYGEGGDGAGYVIDHPVEVAGEQRISVTIGSGGGGGSRPISSTAGTAGKAGGVTSFGSHISISGGGGGEESRSSNNQWPRARAEGKAYGESPFFKFSPPGPGRAGVDFRPPSTAGPGCGGGGGYGVDSNNQWANAGEGGDGGRGEVIIEW